MGPAKLALTCTFGIALWSHVCSAQPEGKQQQAPLGPAVFNQVLNWLPTDTETVIGASNPSLTEVEAQVAADSNKLSDPV